MATYTIKDTAPVVYAFAKNNIKKPLLSVLPYFVICGMLTSIVDKSHPVIGVMAQLISFYLSCLYASNIHKAFLHGRNAERFDPFRPTPDDVRFIGMILLVALIIGALAAVAVVLSVATHSVTSVFVIIILLYLPTTVWVALRLSLVFPDRAIGGHMKLQESFALAKGLVWKILITPLAASWLALLAGLGWILIAAILDVFVLQKIFPALIVQENAAFHKLLLYVLISPATVGVTFWYSTVSVATLSNYYLWAKQNPTTVERPAG